MDFFTAIIAGLIQGIFEWLPISSQGNLLGIFVWLGSNPQEAIRLAVMLHIGTLLAAIIYFREEIKKMLYFKGQNEKEIKENRTLLKFIIIATVATAITAIPCYLFLEEMLGTSVTFVLLLLAIFLIITGVIQIVKKNVGDGKISTKNAILTGLGQGFSVLPGVSRSGTTTSVLLFRGFKPEESFRISFIMSIPAVFLADVAYGILKGFVFDEFAILALVIAFVVGLLSMDLLIKFARKINFAYFCFVLAGVYIVAFLFLI